MTIQNYLLFCSAVLLLALSPGPNWAYLISRSLSHGRKAGLFSLLGMLTAFLFYMTFTAVGLSVLFKTIPVLYWVLKIGGALYLFWLAWKSVKPNAASMFEKADVKRDSNWKLYKMGFLTNLLNPKTAVFYIAVFPAFLPTKHEDVFIQTTILGTTQIIISFVMNACVVCTASLVSKFLNSKNAWLKFQKWFTGSVLALLGIRMLLTKSK